MASRYGRSTRQDNNGRNAPTAQWALFAAVCFGIVAVTSFALWLESHERSFAPIAIAFAVAAGLWVLVWRKRRMTV